MTTLLVDATNVAMTAVFATQHEPMTAPDGTPTGALVVMVNRLAKLVAEEGAERLLLCWDGGTSWRTALDPAYKALRPAHDPALADYRDTTFAMLQRFADLAGLPQAGMPGEEADDLIAAAWRSTQMDGGPARELVTSSGEKFWVSPEDYERVAAKTWSLTSNGRVRNGTTANGKYVGTMLHRFVLDLGPEDEAHVDHRNGDPKDNRRSNLRLVNPAQNGQNRQSSKDWGHSQHRGVSWNKNRQKWIAYGYIGRKMPNLGYFLDEAEAARVAREWREEHFTHDDRDEASKSPADQKIVIVSSDKDLCQMLGPNPHGVQTEVIRLGSRNGTSRTDTDRWTAQRLRTEGLPMGKVPVVCEPWQLPLVMALTGDKVDGVVGVPGVGPVRAQKLLAADDWDLPTVAERLVDLGRTTLGQVLTDLQLVQLRHRADLDVVAPPLRPTQETDPLWQDLLEFLDHYEMATLKNRLLSGALWRPLAGRSADGRLPRGVVASA